MRVLLRYKQRLGDIIQLFPAAQALRDKGHEPWIECDSKYHDIFHAVSYVRPLTYAERRLKFDRILSLGIHPTSGGSLERYTAYRESGKKWSEFVYNDPLIRGTYGLIDFDKTGYCEPKDYGLPDDPLAYGIIAPHGYSQVTKYDPAALISYAMEHWAPARTLILSEKHGAGAVSARRLRDLPDIISWPKHFAAINSAPALIRQAMRKPYVHFPQTGIAAQDDTAFPGLSQVVIPCHQNS